MSIFADLQDILVELYFTPVIILMEKWLAESITKCALRLIPDVELRSRWSEEWLADLNESQVPGARFLKMSGFVFVGAKLYCAEKVSVFRQYAGKLTKTLRLKPAIKARLFMYYFYSAFLLGTSTETWRLGKRLIVYMNLPQHHTFTAAEYGNIFFSVLTLALIIMPFLACLIKFSFIKEEISQMHDYYLSILENGFNQTGRK
jgi:hypothetical protein